MLNVSRGNVPLMRNILPSYIMQGIVILFIARESRASFVPMEPKTVTLAIVRRGWLNHGEKSQWFAKVTGSYDKKSALALFLALPSAARL